VIEASVWFSGWICTPSLASTAWCRPSLQRRPGHQAAGELVDDHDLALLHHVVLVAVVQVVGPQRRVQVVHQRDVGRVVQRGALGQQAQVEQDALGVLVALLGQEDLVRLLVDREVARLGDAFAGARVGLAFLLASAAAPPC
jgi:hypothetical protein